MSNTTAELQQHNCGFFGVQDKSLRTVADKMQEAAIEQKKSTKDLTNRKFK